MSDLLTKLSSQSPLPQYSKEFGDILIKHLSALELSKKNFLDDAIPGAIKSDKKLKSFNPKGSDNPFFNISNTSAEEHMVLQGYQALFHAFESFSIALKFFINDDIKKYKKEFNNFCTQFGLVTITSGGHLAIDCESLQEIQWICNCSKHNGGRSSLSNEKIIPLSYLLGKIAIDNGRIKVSKQMLEKHYDFMLKYYIDLPRNIFYVKNLFILEKLRERNVIPIELNQMMKTITQIIKSEIGLYFVV